MKMLLNGEWVDRSQKLEVRDPYDQSLVDTVPMATHEDMEAAIASAEKAFAVARKLPAYRRMAILNKAVELMGARQEEFARTIAREGIKTIREARKEVTRAMDTMRISAEEARRISGETIPFDQLPSGERRIGYYLRMPIGIIAAITPFNDPLNLVAHKVGPAIASGNCVIVKPHSATPLSALLLAEVIQQAGLPAGILQVITGRGSEVGASLASDPRVRMVSFTGGLQTGMDILQKSGLKKVGMELGSNSPVIVMADADLDLAVESCVSGAFWAAGQNCLHVQRLLVQEPIYEAFKARAVAAARGYHLGSKLDEKTDMGVIVSISEAERIENWVNEAIEKGADLLCGGVRTNGTHYPPTFLENVPDHATMATEEIYGPVTALYPFKTLDEAIQRANAVNYGLQAGIFTKDLNTAYKAIAELEVGGVMVNESTDYRIDAMPFGGIKGSGLGREGIRFALQEMTEPKLVCITL
jgi:glyceraldehyde-3-phosphate dehydrogenase (NADP+)